MLIYILAILKLLTNNPVLAILSPNMFVRLENPQSPTNVNNFGIDFVVIDNQNRALTVSCFKRNPDASVVQIGGDINLIPGGNSGRCNLNLSPLTQNGVYGFYAVAKTGSEEYVSETVNVDYSQGGPSSPVFYSKDELTSCVYRLKFKTADDGKTTKLEIFRSSETSFVADAASRIAELTIDPNIESTFDDGRPDCNKTYYYVIRSKDAAGNVSSLVGDKVNVTNTLVTVVEGSNTGAIKNGIGSNSFGLEPETQIKDGDVLVTGAVPRATDSAILGRQIDIKNSGNLGWLIAIGSILFAILGIVYAKRKGSSKKKK